MMDVSASLSSPSHQGDAFFFSFVETVNKQLVMHFYTKQNLFALDDMVFLIHVSCFFGLFFVHITVTHNSNNNQKHTVNHVRFVPKGTFGLFLIILFLSFYRALQHVAKI